MKLVPYPAVVLLGVGLLLAVTPFNPPPWMYALPLVGQQLAITQILRGEVIAHTTFILCTISTLAVFAAVFFVALRIYESERLAVNA